MGRLCIPFRRRNVSSLAGHAVTLPVDVDIQAHGGISAVRSRMLRPLLALSAAALVQACATPYGTAVRQYRDVPVCCTSLAQLPVEPLQVGDKKSFDLGDGSLAYRFDTGKSYFRAYALPQGPYPFRVSVRSFLVGDRLRDAYLFYPQLITLDEQHRVVRTTGPGTFTLERAGLLETLETGGLSYKLEGGLTFTADTRDERYLVVLTTDELLRGKTLVSTVGAVPMLLPAYSGTTPTSMNEAQVPHAPVGRMAISVAPLAPQPSVAAAAGASVAGETKGPSPVIRPEAVTAHLANGKAIGELELGRTTVDGARRLFDTAGAGLGPERRSGATITIGDATLEPKRLFAPPGTQHQLYFNDSGVLVLFVAGPSADLPASSKEFLRRFPGARETGRTLGSRELQASLASCVTLIAVFRSGDDSLDSAAYGYSCPTR